jgi:C4-dicarboxylate-binding protein DctP
VDAQENPFANTVTYGCHKVHRYVTLTNHCYMSRGLYLCRSAFEGWPEQFQTAMQRAAREAIALQREYAVAEEETARKALEAEGCEFTELTADQRAAFARAVKPVHDEARSRFGDEVFGLLRGS